MTGFCEVGYSTTLAKAKGDDFKVWGKVIVVEGSECTIKWQTEMKSCSHYIIDVFLTAFHTIPSPDSASKARLYPESDHKTYSPKNVPTLRCLAKYPHAE